MPKRVVDGLGIWRSDKIARIEPQWIRAEYANWVPLAMANGVFECNPRRIWAEIYSYNRPAITPEIVELEILPAFQRVALIFTWTDGCGKQWGYFVGIDKPGRLPGQSRRGRNEAVGPEPPADGLRKFLESNGIQMFPGSGSGSCLGSGKGSGSGGHQDGPLVVQPPKAASPSAFKGTHLKVTERQDGLLSEAFPWISRQAEYRKADAWLEANPDKRPRKQSKFINNWFQRIKEPKEVSRATERTKRNLANREEFLASPR